MGAFYLAIAGAGLLGVLEALVFPYRRCKPCKGGGKIWSPLNSTAHWRNCGACGGSGKKRRFLAAMLGRK